MAKTILLVDDSATLLMSLQSGLKSHGFHIETAEDGQMALTKLTQNKINPDFILTDLNMPNMNGFDFVKAVRMLPTFRFIPIVILTTKISQPYRDKAKKVGATGWLVKPVSIEKLLAVIGELVH